MIFGMDATALAWIWIAGWLSWATLVIIWRWKKEE